MKRLAVGLLALVILIGCAAVYAADTGTGESLVTQGYLNDTYIPDVLRQAETRIAEQTKTVYDSVLADLNARHSGYLARAGGEQSYAASITDFRFKRGDVVSLPAGSGLLAPGWKRNRVLFRRQCGGYYGGADRGLRHRADRTSPRLSGRKYHSGSDNHL